MKVKDCAAELGLPVTVVRELLRCGLLAGEKRQGSWWVAAPSLEALRSSVALLQAALPCGVEDDLWSWLYEPETSSPPPQGKPWQAMQPPHTDVLLGRRALCPRCGQGSELRLLDADLGEVACCRACGWEAEAEPANAEPLSFPQHCADYELGVGPPPDPRTQ